MKIDFVATTRTNWYNLNDTEEFLNRPAGFYFTLDNKMSYGPFNHEIDAKIAYLEYLRESQE
jgi:hypothetical protein